MCVKRNDELSDPIYHRHTQSLKLNLLSWIKFLNLEDQQNLGFLEVGCCVQC